MLPYVFQKSDFQVAMVPLEMNGTQRLGKLQFKAPEALEGAPDRRTDLWSLGCCMYQMATGLRPYDAETEEKVTGKIRRGFDELWRPKALERQEVDLLKQLMKKKPEQRIGALSGQTRRVLQHPCLRGSAGAPQESLLGRALRLVGRAIVRDTRAAIAALVVAAPAGTAGSAAPPSSFGISDKVGEGAGGANLSRLLEELSGLLARAAEEDEGGSSSFFLESLQQLRADDDMPPSGGSGGGALQLAISKAGPTFQAGEPLSALTAATAEPMISEDSKDAVAAKKGVPKADGHESGFRKSLHKTLDVEVDAEPLSEAMAAIATELDDECPTSAGGRSGRSGSSLGSDCATDDYDHRVDKPRSQGLPNSPPEEEEAPSVPAGSDIKTSFQSLGGPAGGNGNFGLALLAAGAGQSPGGIVNFNGSSIKAVGMWSRPDSEPPAADEVARLQVLIGAVRQACEETTADASDAAAAPCRFGQRLVDICVANVAWHSLLPDTAKAQLERFVETAEHLRAAAGLVLQKSNSNRSADEIGEEDGQWRREQTDNIALIADEAQRCFEEAKGPVDSRLPMTRQGSPESREDINGVFSPGSSPLPARPHAGPRLDPSARLLAAENIPGCEVPKAPESGVSPAAAAGDRIAAFLPVSAGEPEIVGDGPPRARYEKEGDGGSSGRSGGRSGGGSGAGALDEEAAENVDLEAQAGDNSGSSCSPQGGAERALDLGDKANTTLNDVSPAKDELVVAQQPVVQKSSWSRCCRRRPAKRLPESAARESAKAATNEHMVGDAKPMATASPPPRTLVLEDI
eukprot:TRINITY_DN10058_c0_g2_i4.p1 TRINITY_DN10058_c0_g2~~TRINITY_DN10058_c0_g2_i4.p1  ORF type:complete len:801 (+),score=206.62 TRINITY_DN10058_c0_g2_i4:136-2538(+)